MWLIDYSLSNPAANLAFDEALVESADSTTDEHNLAVESLRLWEMPALAVVMGRGSKQEEVNHDSCRRDAVPIFRRCSGGASIVAGPGCLMYSLLLSLTQRPQLRCIDTTHRFVMDRIAGAVRELVPSVTFQGTCDLTWNGCKCSGNAVRFKRDWILYHGTLLYRFPLELIERYLHMPPRQPDYRQGRFHLDFVTNLPCEGESLKRQLARVWQAENGWDSHPAARSIVDTSHHLLHTKYS